MRHVLLAMAGLVLAFSGSVAEAAFITDGSLTLDVHNDGQFNQITLNTISIDTSIFHQEYYLNGSGGFAGMSPVNVVGSTATYTATAGGFDISVVSRILGPLASAPTTSNVLEQELTFSNNGPASLALAIVSHLDQDLRNTAGGDTVAFDALRQAVFATDPTQLEAVIGKAAGGTLGWDVATLGGGSTNFPMNNRVGPTGPSDTEMDMGFDLGSIGAGQSATVTFRYLFSTDMETVPSDFVFAEAAIPEPVSSILLLLGLGALGVRRRRRA